jgi:hypothetical protein
MRKTFFKSLAVFMAACMFVMIGSGFTAGNDEGFTEIVVEGVDCCQKEQQIIDAINGEELIAPMNILCLFGHSMAQGTAVITDHRFWATSPRCRQTTYRVNYCTRSSCNHIVYTQLTQSRIPCCS